MHQLIPGKLTTHVATVALQGAVTSGRGSDGFGSHLSEAGSSHKPGKEGPLPAAGPPMLRRMLQGVRRASEKASGRMARLEGLLQGWGDSGPQAASAARLRGLKHQLHELQLVEADLAAQVRACYQIEGIDRR